MAKNEIILFSDVTMKYPSGVVALSRLNFTIERGEFVFVVGASGAGKTTLQKLILCEELPTAGAVRVNGQLTQELKHREMPLFRRDIGVVFQDFRLLPGRSVYDNVAFALQIRGASYREIRRAVPQILGLVGLSDRAKVRPNSLSGGEKQRCAIARAMVAGPPILLADEPTGNLDPTNASEIMYLLDVINKQGTTVLTVTHSKESVNKMKKRVIELENGVLMRDQSGGRYNNPVPRAFNLNS